MLREPADITTHLLALISTLLPPLPPPSPPVLPTTPVALGRVRRPSPPVSSLSTLSTAKSGTILAPDLAASARYVTSPDLLLSYRSEKHVNPASTGPAGSR